MSRHRALLRLERFEVRETPSVSAVGPELAINSYTTGTQRMSAIALDADGDFVVAWESTGQDGNGNGIYVRRYSAGGSAQGTEILVNTFTTGNQSAPAVAIDADGDFVVAWKSLSQDGDNYGIFAQRFSAAGSPRGQEFQVNQQTTGSQDDPSVASDADGNFVIVWESLGQDGSGDGVYARRFDADGSSLGPEFRVNGFTAGQQSSPSIGMTANGAFVVTWESIGQDGDSYGIYAQRYSAAGVALSTEFRVNTFTALGQSGPAIGLDIDGDFVVVWISDRQEGASFALGVYGQNFTAAGVPDGAEFRVNTVTSGNQSNPSVARAVGGVFVVAWQSDGPGQDGSGIGIYARLYTAAGLEASSEFKVNTHTTSTQNNPAISADAEGDFVVTWSGAGSIDTAGISAQRYDEFVDAAPPWIADVFPANGVDPIREGERLAAPVAALVVSVSEDFSIAGGAAGPNSATNPANWVLTRNAVAVPITGIIYGFNSLTRRFEATLMLAAPLTDGNYVLTSQSALRDAAGNALDGDRDGVPGGSSSRMFRVAVPVVIGPEFRVNETTTGLDYDPAVAVDASGNFVVVWTRTDQSIEVYGRRYNFGGVPLGGEFRVNTFTTGNQLSPVVAMSANGDFAIAWASYGQDGSGGGVYAQRYLANGTPAGGEFRANVTTTGTQRSPALAMDVDGNFIIAWDGGDFASGYDVYARRYAADGTPLSDEFRVNTYTTGRQDRPAVAADADGNFVIGWRSRDQDGSFYGIYAQRYNSAGAPLGGEFQVNTHTTEDQTQPSIAADVDGDFVIAWLSFGQDGNSGGIYAQRYSAAGTVLPRPAGAIPGLGPNEFRVNTFTTGDQSFPSATMDADGDFAIAWQSLGQDGSQEAVIAQRFASDGVPQSGEFRVNTYTTDRQFLPAMACEADGDFVVAWTSRSQDGDMYGVYAQRYGVPPPRVAGVQVNDGTAQRSRVTSLQVTFTGEVTFAVSAGTAFTLTRDGGGAVTFQATPSIVNGVTVVTLDAFTGSEAQFSSLRDGRYTLTVLANQITDSFGQTLDGNGDGTAGDNHTFGDPEGLFRYFGDHNGNRQVDNVDFFFFRPALGSSFPAANYVAAFDFDGNGFITNTDLFQFKIRLGILLP